MTEHPVISLVDLNFNYILGETLSTNPIHYIETTYDMQQLIVQPTRVDDKTSSVLDVIIMSHPALRQKSAVFKSTVVDHNTVKFRDMKNFDMGSLSNDLISCDILNS